MRVDRGLFVKLPRHLSKAWRYNQLFWRGVEQSGSSLGS